MAEQNPQDLLIKSFEKNGSGRFYANVTLDDGSKYVYVPQEFVLKGARIGDTQYFDQSFLNKDYLGVLKPIQLSEDVLYDSIKNVGYENPNTGYLISQEDLKKYDAAPDAVTSYKAVGKFAGDVKGIGEKDGQLVYSFGGAGGSNYGIIDSSGTPTETTITESGRGGGWFKKALGEVAETFAGIPFAPEIIGFATQNPYLYGSLKSLQTAGAGGDLGDVLEAGAKGTAGALIGQEIFAGAPTEVTPGVDYSLTGGGYDVGGLGFQASPEMLAPEIGASVGAGGAAAALPGLVIDPTSLAPSLGVNIGTPVVSPADYSLLSGSDFSGTGQTGITLGTSGQGLQLPTSPDLSSMGGGQGLTVPVQGGTVGELGFTPEGAVPVLGDPESFINDPSVLGRDVIAQGTTSSIGIRDALDAARLGRNIAGLLGNQQQPQQTQPFMQMPQGAVDYSGLLSLLASRPGTPNIYSLIG